MQSLLLIGFLCKTIKATSLKRNRGKPSYQRSDCFQEYNKEESIIEQCEKITNYQINLTERLQWCYKQLFYLVYGFTTSSSK